MAPDVELKLPGVTARFTGSSSESAPVEVWTVVAVSDNQFRFGLHPFISVHATRDAALRALRYYYAETLADYGCDWHDTDNEKAVKVLTKIGVLVSIDKHEVISAR